MKFPVSSSKADRFRLILRAVFVVPPGDLPATSVAFGINCPQMKFPVSSSKADRFRLILRAVFVAPPGDLPATSVAFGIVYHRLV